MRQRLRLSDGVGVGVGVGGWDPSTSKLWASSSSEEAQESQLSLSHPAAICSRFHYLHNEGEGGRGEMREEEKTQEERRVERSEEVFKSTEACHITKTCRFKLNVKYQ